MPHITRRHFGPQVIVTVLRTAGRTCAVSGITLALSFVGLAMIPLDMLRAIGIGSALTLGATVSTRV